MEESIRLRIKASAVAKKYEKSADFMIKVCKLLLKILP